MFVLISLFCFLFSYYSIAVNKRWYCPSGLFSSFWGILIFLSGLRLYGVIETPLSVYLLVFLGVSSFFLGCWFVDSNWTITCSNRQVLNVRLYKIAVLVCVCSLYLNILFIFRFISSGFDLHFIYSVMASIGEGNNENLSHLYDAKLLMLQQFVGYPLLFVLVPISIVEYINTKNKEYLLVAIVLSLLRFLFDIRRTYLVILIVFIVLFVVIRRKEYNLNFFTLDFFQNKLTRKQRTIIFVSLMFTTVAFSWLSSARRGNEADSYSLFSNFYYYYVGSLPYFGRRLSLLNDIDFTYGLTSFRGLFSPLFGLLGLLGFSKPEILQLANDNVNSLHNVVLLISNNHKFNSYATSFFEFYLDGGWVGVAVFSFLFGCYSQQLFKKSSLFCCERYMWKYALFVSIFIYFSVLHFNGSVVCYIWPFIIEKFFYSRECYDLEN